MNVRSLLACTSRFDTSTQNVWLTAILLGANLKWMIPLMLKKVDQHCFDLVLWHLWLLWPKGILYLHSMGWHLASWQFPQLSREFRIHSRFHRTLHFHVWTKMMTQSSNELVFNGYLMQLIPTFHDSSVLLLTWHSKKRCCHMVGIKLMCVKTYLSDFVYIELYFFMHSNSHINLKAHPPVLTADT
jgi:hypothetical protein